MGLWESLRQWRPNRFTVGVAASIFLHLALIAMVLWGGKTARLSKWETKKGDSIIVELPKPDEPAPRGSNSAPAPAGQPTPPAPPAPPAPPVATPKPPPPAPPASRPPASEERRVASAPRPPAPTPPAPKAAEPPPPLPKGPD